MVNISENIINPDFKSDNNTKLNLSLLIGPDRLTYLYYDEISGNFKEINNLFIDLKKDFDSTLSDNFGDLSDFEKIEIYLIPDSCSTSFTEEASVKNTITGKDLYSNFDSYKNIKFENTENIITLLINKFIDKNSVDKSIFSYWTQGKFFLGFINNGILEDFQTFFYKTAEDALYFTLYFYDQHNSDSLTVPFYISGQLFQNSSIYKLLYFYVRHLNFCERDEKHLLLPCFENQPGHLYWDILNTIP